jgi:hypothetical protein
MSNESQVRWWRCACYFSAAVCAVAFLAHMVAIVQDLSLALSPGISVREGLQGADLKMQAGLRGATVLARDAAILGLACLASLRLGKER